MKSNSFQVLVFLASISLAACNNNSKEAEEVQTKDSTVVETISEPNLNIDALAMQVDQKRQEIEELEAEPLELSTATLREKIKQKWSKIHIYSSNGKVVKIKTYPHDGISKRTEEFYADDSGLILVVIEDDGEGEKGKSKDQLDKMYYFNDGELIRELKNNQETEFNQRNSDAEELQAEFDEYMQLYQSSMK